MMAGLVVGAGVLEVACGESQGQVEVPRYAGEPNGDDAAMVGALVVVNNCLFVRLDTGEDVLTAFPSAFTRWDNKGQVLTLSGREIPLGEPFVFGGSGHPLANLSDVRWSTPSNQACAGDSPYIWMAGETAAPLSEHPQFRSGLPAPTPAAGRSRIP